ncbi:MAG TPA: 2-amino-4-hydroxy-6-hydroxymethyldihydropteridine diphosphokinase [Arcobacter sp.]|nr:2-amino-4-hydroxy-6-hydroxymethyldihydropteridine diphosphokinase [Arcobacter sp.]
MKKRISKELNLYFTNNFPYKSKKTSNKKYSVVIGIGGNIGNTKKIFNQLFLDLKSDSRFSIVQTSPLLKNPPFGFLEQNYFLNALIVFKTNLSPLRVLDAMQRYENRFKRKRSFQDAPRTLDNDIIFIKNNNTNIKLNTKRLIVPHHGYKQRDSVLIPLKYITKF